MSDFLVMRYIGATGVGMGALYVGNGVIVGADAGNGRYNGTYSESGDRIRGEITLSMSRDGTLVTGDQVPAGTSIPMTVDWPADYANGQPQQIMVGGRPVNVTFEKVAAIP